LFFQPLDNKNQCIGYYAEGNFYYYLPDASLTKTWDYSTSLKNYQIEFGRVYCNGKNLTEVCPPQYKSMWERIKTKFEAFRKSFILSKLNLEELCLYEILPEPFLFEFYDLKNEITKHVFETYPRPQNHDDMTDVLKLIGDIRQQPLRINLSAIKHKLGSLQGKNFAGRIQKIKKICDYNPWGTITGRLAGVPNTFPILTLNKEFRGCIFPQNDWFLELDYNAAEVRTLLALSGESQPEQDIHEWNIKNIYDGNLTREEAKKKIFAWLYSKRANKRAQRFYNKELVLEKYWDGHDIVTEFKREIKNVDNHHALNYIIQSTTSDLVLAKAVQINDKLKEQKSNIAFMLHDSIVIDLKDEDRYLIPDLMKSFSETKFGKYKVNISVGKTFGEMKRLNYNG